MCIILRETICPDYKRGFCRHGWSYTSYISVRSEFDASFVRTTMSSKTHPTGFTLWVSVYLAGMWLISIPNTFHLRFSLKYKLVEIFTFLFNGIELTTRNDPDTYGDFMDRSSRISVCTLSELQFTMLNSPEIRIPLS